MSGVGLGEALAYMRVATASAEDTCHILSSRYGFRWAGDFAEPSGAHVTVLAQGATRLLVTQASNRAHPASVALTRNVGRASIYELGVKVSNAKTAEATLVAAGSRVVEHVSRAGRDDRAWMSGTFEAPDGLRHTVVEALGLDGEPWLPHPIAKVPPDADDKAGTLRVDHLALLVAKGEMHPVCDFYEAAMGMTTVFTDRVDSGGRGMDSRVVASSNRGIVLTVIEPLEPKDGGQIGRFLDEAGGAGIQHVALATRDIVASVDRLSLAGVRFNRPPSGYYAHLADRAGARHTVAALSERGLLRDSDHDGDLYQVFCESELGNFFFEIIERDGAETFGGGNVRALFESHDRPVAAV